MKPPVTFRGPSTIARSWSGFRRPVAVRPARRSVTSTVPCNPYGGMAVILASGLDGIERNLPDRSGERGLFEKTAEERAALGVVNLPDNLKEAIGTLSADEIVKEALGEHIFEKFVELKSREWDDFRQAVTVGNQPVSQSDVKKQSADRSIGALHRLVTISQEGSGGSIA